MLANRMSNQDEDEVEDELDALELEVVGVKQILPDAPSVMKGEMPDVPQESPAEKARRRRLERARAQGTEPIAA